MTDCELYALAWRRLGLHPRDLIAMDSQVLRAVFDYLQTTTHQGPLMTKDSAAVNVKPARNPLNPETPEMRVYELAYFTDPDHPGTSPVATKRVNAAWWETDGDSRIGVDTPTYDFVTFKDPDGKKVFTIRRSMVAVIQELRGATHEPVDRPFLQVTTDIGTRSYAAPHHEKILKDVVRGKLSIDAARDLLGLVPFNLPGTIVPLRYDTCPNGCGPDSTCSDCPSRG